MARSGQRGYGNAGRYAYTGRTHGAQSRAVFAVDLGALVPVNLSLPAISGAAQEGQTLSVSNGSWSNSPTGFIYQWKRNGVAIAGSVNSTRTLVAADIAAAITCTVVAANLGGPSLPVTTLSTAAVIAASVPVPGNTVAPAVTGTGTVGQVLTTSNGTWSNSPTSFSYAWRRDGVDIAGATSVTYTLVTADTGHSVTCRVFATNAGGTAGATSNILAVAASAFVDPDLNAASAFKSQVKSYDTGSGDRAAQLFAAFPALKAYLNVGVKTDVSALTAGGSHPNWNASGKRLDVVTATPTITGYDFQGSVLVGPSVAANVTISNCRIRANSDGSSTTYKVQKDNSDANYLVTVQDATLQYGQANDPNRFSLKRVLQQYSETDNFKGGSTGGAAAPQRIEFSWGEACGYGNTLAHGDGAQFSTYGDARIVCLGLYSAPTTSTYSTNSYGLTNAIRIDASGAPKTVERVHVLGMMSAHGGNYPLTVTPQQTDSMVRNITVAFCVFAPAAFRVTGSTDAIQMHPSLTDFGAGGGKMENVAFFGNEVFGYGPLVYADRGAAAADITGIWHWNPATLDAETLALWKDIGLLTSGGTPAAGMLRSVAGSIATQVVPGSASGGTALGLDLSNVPAGVSVTLHLPGPEFKLEYLA